MSKPVLSIVKFSLITALILWLAFEFSVALWFGALVPAEHNPPKPGVWLRRALITYLCLCRNGQLELAVTYGDATRAKFALSTGANPNFLERDGDTLLMLVCQNHGYAMAKILLEHGADPNIQMDNGDTALMIAARGFYPELVQLLLQHGAKVGTVNSKGQTALFWAKVSGDKRIVSLLEQSTGAGKVSEAHPEHDWAVEAAQKYRKAAEEGDAKAQAYLAWCYDEGCGVIADKAEAAKWIRKAAEQGKSSAQYQLGIRYRDGIGISKDFIEAYTWFSLAGAAEYTPGGRQCKIIAQQMTPAQIAEAELRAKQWQREFAQSHPANK